MHAFDFSISKMLIAPASCICVEGNGFCLVTLCGAWQVIDLTKDLLKESAAALQQQAQPAKGSRWGEVKPAAPAPEPAPVLPSILPPQVAQQIRAAQIRAALSGQAPAAWAVGAKCQAMYSADGEFYAATVTGVSAAGNFVVMFDAYGNSEEVGPIGQVFLIAWYLFVVSRFCSA